jgi:hypothetical protein
VKTPVEKDMLSAANKQHLSTTPLTPAGNIVDMQGSIHQSPQIPEEDEKSLDTESANVDTKAPELCPNETLQPDSLLSQLEEQQPVPETPAPEADTCGPCVVITVEPDGSDIIESEEQSLFPEEQQTMDEIPLVAEDGSQQPVNSEPYMQTDKADTSTTDNSAADQSLEVCQRQNSITADGENQDYINPQGVRFIPQETGKDGEILYFFVYLNTKKKITFYYFCSFYCIGSAPLLPYGVACVRELFRFLVSLCSPHDKQNTEVMIHIGLTLLTVALEIGADHIGRYASLLALVKDELCRNLFSVSVLQL